jgi:hypothetical protein
MGRPRTAALQQKSFPDSGQEASVPRVRSKAELCPGLRVYMF